MMQFEGMEHINIEWIDNGILTAFVYEEIRSIQPANPIFDNTQPIHLPMVINKTGKDYGVFAFNIQVMVPISFDTQDDGACLTVYGDYRFGDHEDDELDLMPLSLHTVMFDDDDNLLLAKNERRKGLMKYESYMDVLPAFYEAGYTDDDLQRWGIVV